MGCEAEVIAIGPFSRSIVDALEYPAAACRDVAEGITVITKVFGAYDGGTSRELAKCFGVGAWDLGRHVLDAWRADVAMLRIYDNIGVEDFLVLRTAGFQFYYLPNG